MNDEDADAGMFERIARARTILFVPGDKPDVITKAFSSGADAIIIDLEDAVQPSRRAYARTALVHWMSTSYDPTGPLVLVRTNAAQTDEFEVDRQALLEGGVHGVVLPKFGGSAADVACARVGTLPVIAIVETASGLLGVMRRSKVPANVCRLAFGSGDFSADIGVAWAKANPSVDAARCQLVWASAALGLTSPVDTAYPWMDDADGLRAEARFASSIGYGAKFCIHPAQLKDVAAAFTPSAEEAAWAERVLDLWERHTDLDGAFRLDGLMIDEAVVKRARRVRVLAQMSGADRGPFRARSAR